MDNNLTFSKIVATPTLNSWSQAYNAGKLFAVLSLEKTQDLPETESLNMIGKNLLEHLEQEFFAIEEKNLESIKKAISTIFENSINGVAVSFAAGAVVNDVMYLFGLGNAKVFIKREDNLGTALAAEDSSSINISSSSGFLKENDLIVLTTDAFSQVISQEDLNFNLTNIEPAEIAESLAPKIHKAENGKISAIIIKYKNPLVQEIIDEGISEQEEEVQEVNTKESISPIHKALSFIKSKVRIPNFKFQPTNRLFLILAIVIIGILIFSASFAIQQQNNAKIKTLFAQIYPEAQKKYDEGLSLVDLNKNFARDSFVAAQKILNDNKAQFPAKSKEATQTQDLLAKVDAGLAQVSPVDKSGLDRSKLSVAIQNGSGVEGVAGKAAVILKDLGYNVVSTGNADNYNYQGVTINVKSESNNFLNLLKQDLAKDYTVTTSSSDLPSDSPTSAIIIIGK